LVQHPELALHHVSSWGSPIIPTSHVSSADGIGPETHARRDGAWRSVRGAHHVSLDGPLTRSRR
jgi:hypothetical protein